MSTDPHSSPVASIRVAQAVYYLDGLGRRVGQSHRGEDAAFQLPGESLPEVAIQALMTGYDSQSLRELASLEKPTRREAGPLFEAAVSELGLEPVDDLGTAFLVLVREVAEKVVAGGRQPLEGAAALEHFYYRFYDQLFRLLLSNFSA